MSVPLLSNDRYYSDESLFFVSYWSLPGGGVYAVRISGVQAAQKVLGIDNQSGFF